MSDEQQQESQDQPQEQVTPPEPAHECEFCGENGFYGNLCTKCKRPITQRRQYTLSEVRSGRAPDQQGGRPSGAPPRIVEVPGSMRIDDVGK
jgi:hypothetical protein